MSEKKTAKENDYENIYMDVVKLVEQDNIVADLYSETVKKLKDKYIIRLRDSDTLTDQEREALDQIEWPLKHVPDEFGGYAEDVTGVERVVDLYIIGNQENKDIIGNLITKLLNQAQEGRGR
jgi:hypothetical protein